MRVKDERLCEQRRGRIMAAARGRFARLGYDACSMGSIAAAAGVNKATLYYYFKGKRDLLKALLHDSWLRRTSRAAADGLKQERDARRLLRRLAALYLGELRSVEDREFNRILLAECLRDPELAAENVLHTDRTFEEYAAAVRPAFGSGLPTRRVKQALHQFKGALLHYAQYTRLMRIPLKGLGSERSYVEALVETFARGLGAPAAERGA